MQSKLSLRKLSCQFYVGNAGDDSAPVSKRAPPPRLRCTESGQQWTGKLTLVTKASANASAASAAGPAPAAVAGGGGAAANPAAASSVVSDFPNWQLDTWAQMDFDQFRFPTDPCVSICSVRAYLAVAMILRYDRDPQLWAANARVWDELQFA